jgi:hypothetical protein
MRRAHQPGSQPIDIPEVIPNPAVVPRPERPPREPAPKEPVKIPGKVPAGIVLPESSLAAANQCPRAHLGPGSSHFASWISLAPPDDMPTELEKPTDLAAIGEATRHLVPWGRGNFLLVL